MKCKEIISINSIKTKDIKEEEEVEVVTEVEEVGLETEVDVVDIITNKWDNKIKDQWHHNIRSTLDKVRDNQC